MDFPDPYAGCFAPASLVTQPEAVPATPLTFAPRKPHPATRAFGFGVGGECTTKVDCSLLKYLRGDLLPPTQARHLLDGSAVPGNDKHSASLLGLLPCVERVDQVEARQGTATEGSVAFAWRAPVTNRKDWL